MPVGDGQVDLPDKELMTNIRPVLARVVAQDILAESRMEQPMDMAKLVFQSHLGQVSNRRIRTVS